MIEKIGAESLGHAQSPREKRVLRSAWAGRRLTGRLRFPAMFGSYNPDRPVFVPRIGAFGINICRIYAFSSGGLMWRNENNSATS
jgi:hypothetical protein